MTSEIIIYSKDYCPYCKRAKALLTAKGVSFTELDIVDKEALTREMIEKSGGRRTVPQIFIGEVHVGGASDLFELDEAGKLDELLKTINTAT